MKILSLSLDKSIFKKDSSLAKRTIGYGLLVEKYTVIAPAPNCQEKDLSDKVRVYGVSSPNRFFSLLKIYVLAKKILASEKHDVITVQDPYYLALIGLLLVKRFNLGLEIQIHGWEKYNGLRKYAAKFTIPRADSIRVVSQRLKQQMIKGFGVRPEKITVVPIHVEVSQQLISASKSQGKFIFLTVGRLVPVKNISLQIRAMAEIVKKYPNTELWIIGEGNEKKNYELRIKNYELNNNIKLLGCQKNVADFYRRADVFILTSFAEGWPLVVIEAANYGLPIIMTDVGSAGEFIINRENGLVVKVDDAAELQKAMAELIENDELRRRLGEKARQAALNLPPQEEIFQLYKESWEKAKNG